MRISGTEPSSVILTITPIKLQLHKVPNESVHIEENWGQGCQNE